MGKFNSFLLIVAIFSIPYLLLGHWGSDDVWRVSGGSGTVGGSPVLVVDAHGHVAGEGESPRLDGRGVEPWEVPGRRGKGGGRAGHSVSSDGGRRRGPSSSPSPSHSVVRGEGKSRHVGGDGLRGGQHLGGVGAAGGIVAGVASHGGSGGGLALLQLLQALLTVLAAETDAPSPLLLAIAGTSILEPDLVYKKKKVVSSNLLFQLLLLSQLLWTTVTIFVIPASEPL